MRELWLYDWMSRLARMNYRAKILVVAFIGTHIPLIALVGYFAVQTSPDWTTLLTTVGITLAATLVGTGLTVFVLNELLRPVVVTSMALRTYREFRKKTDLPTGYIDEVGTLMADAGLTIEYLDRVRDALEYIDEATGLPNRKRLIQMIPRLISKGERFAVAVVRFGNFERIAEALDMRHADAAAKELARRLAQGLHNSETLARISSAEFAFLVTGRNLGTSELTATLTELTAGSRVEITLADLAVAPELLCGVAVHPDDAHSATELLDNASSAAVQGSVAAPVVHHAKEARAEALEQMRMEQDLRRAIQRNEFLLYYQPIVDLDACRTRGAEALIRWQHPKYGMVPPVKFIPAAEASGLIKPIGVWVIREACRQIREWTESGRKDVKVAINLSAVQFLDPDLNGHVADAVANAGIDPGQLEIELTETAAMADHQHTKRVFTMLRDLGVTIAIDDFGTGYASMSYLLKLPFDKLKIDREFVCDVYKTRERQAICGALVALARGFGLEVLAEGAETEQEVRYLSLLGCRLFQGYYFAKPLPAVEFGAVADALRLNAFLQNMVATPLLDPSTAKPVISLSAFAAAAG